MDESYVAPMPQAPAEIPRPETGSVEPAVSLQRPVAPSRLSERNARRARSLAIGGLLILVALVLLGGGGTALWADRSQRDGAFVTTDSHAFSTAGSALATTRTELGSAGTGWLYAPSVLDEIRIRVTPVDASTPLFVGIGPSAAVDRYLAGVSHTVITDFWTDAVELENGGALTSEPEAQEFWVASSTGPGARTLTWDPAEGSWTVVVMNADGRPGIDVSADFGARLPALPWIAAGVLVVAVVIAIGGALLISAAVRRSDVSESNTAEERRA